MTQASWTNRPGIVRSAEGAPEGVVAAKPRILVISDNPDTLEANATILRERGFEPVPKRFVDPSKAARLSAGERFGFEAYGAFEHANNHINGIHGVVIDCTDSSRDIANELRFLSVYARGFDGPIVIHTPALSEDQRRHYIKEIGISGAFETGQWDAMAQCLHVGIQTNKLGAPRHATGAQLLTAIGSWGASVSGNPTPDAAVVGK